jgi:hypothetical protein
LVAKLVGPADAAVGPSECLFTTGLVMDWGPNDTFPSPPANDYPALIASNVQIYSNFVNGSVGIYKKVPRNGDPSFCGRESDILGRWQCEDQNSDQTFAPTVSKQQIEESLFSNNLQYSNRSHYDQCQGDESHTSHLVICE